MTPTIPTASLVVTAAVDGTVVWYTIQSNHEGRELNTARFSELHGLSQSLTMEVPSFPGRFPSKTIKRCTSAEFVESRRRDIEMYLRLVATHQEASQSRAWLTFVGGGATNVALSQSEVQQESVDGGGDSGNELNDEFVNVLNSSSDSPIMRTVREMGSMIFSKRDELTAAQKTKRELEVSLSAVEHTVNSAETSAHDKAAFEAEAALRLRYHLLSLEQFGTKLNASQSYRSEEERRLNELVKRFQEELPLVSDSVKKAELSLEKSRHACREAATKAHSSVAAAMAEQVAAETASKAAIERHAVMNAAMGVLQERAKARLDDFKAAEREVDILKVAQQALVAENLEAESQRGAAESASSSAAAAVASYASEAAYRNRAHEVDVGRAEEWASDLAKLQDMMTRELLKDDDRRSCGPFKSTAAAAADTAAEALAEAKQLRDETKEKDEQQWQVLQAAEVKARKRMSYRETFTAVLAARKKDGDAALHKASVKHAAVGATLKAIQEELESLKLRVEGPLANALPECARRLEEAEKVVAAAREQGKEEQTPLRHAEEAEAQLLQKHRAEEASLMQKLRKVQIAAAEAQRGIALRSEHTEGPRSKIDLLVRSCKALWVDLEKRAKEAADASETCHKKAAAIVGDEDVKAAEKLTLETRLDTLQTLEVYHKAAASAGKEQLKALQVQQRATPVPGWYTQKLVREELAIASAGLQKHKVNEKVILSEARQKMADSVKQQEVLAADLRHAELELTVAQENAQATKAWPRVCL